MPTEEIGKLSITIDVDGDKALGVLEAVKKEMEGTRDVEEESTEAIQKNTRKRQTWGKLTLEWLKKVRGYGRTAKAVFDGVAKTVGSNMSMQRLADQMDIPIDKLHEWRMASRRLTGDMQNVTKSLQSLSQLRLDATFAKMPESAEYRALEKLGINAEDFLQMDTSEALAKVLSQAQAMKGSVNDATILRWLQALGVDKSLYRVAGQFPDTIQDVQPFVITDEEIQAMKDLQAQIGLVIDSFTKLGRVMITESASFTNYLAEQAVMIAQFWQDQIKSGGKDLPEAGKGALQFMWDKNAIVNLVKTPGRFAKIKSLEREIAFKRMMNTLEQQGAERSLAAERMLDKTPSANRLKLEENMRNLLKDIPINVTVNGPVLSDALKVEASIGDRKMSTQLELNTDPRVN